jgi:ABC-type dipeptide/oligopeptide/nickel transport system ATPase component
MLKELTLIQEEKIRTTALVQNRGNNSSTSKNTNDFATLTVLLTELKHKYRETCEEWNYMQRKEDINLVKQDIRDTIKPMLTIARQIANILYNNEPFQSQDTPFNSCSISSLQKFTKKTLTELFNNSVFHIRIVNYCEQTHQTTNVIGLSATTPHCTGDPA